MHISFIKGLHKIPLVNCTQCDAQTHFPRLKCWLWIHIHVLLRTCVSATMFSSGFRWTVKASLISLIPSKITSMLTICWVSPSLNSISTNAKSQIWDFYMWICEVCLKFSWQWLTMRKTLYAVAQYICACVCVCVCVNKMESWVWKISLFFCCMFCTQIFSILLHLIQRRF